MGWEDPACGEGKASSAVSEKGDLSTAGCNCCCCCCCCAGCAVAEGAGELSGLAEGCGLAHW